MIQFIQDRWQQISRLGLHEDEGVVDRRDVILLNRVLAIMPVLLLLYLPFELYFNGTSVVSVTFVMISLFLVGLYFNKKRWFKLSKAYIFVIGILMIMFAALFVGKGVNNHVTLIPMLLLGVILFKSNLARYIALIITAGVFFLQLYLLDIVPPTIAVEMEIKTIFSHIFFILALTMSFLLGHYFIGINNAYEGIIVKQKKKAEIQSDLLKEKNKEIVDSITYAKRIQRAILPSLKLFQEKLPESFVLYKPKDIVAGDFYWMEQVDNKILFAAADCTGHGVPGAMVSVLCNNGLNRSVREFLLTEPGQILDKTRELVIEEFSKSEQEVKDGMDIALCSLEGNTMKYAGAHNPLWIIRKDAEEIEEIRANKEPIGNFENPTLFTSHTILLEKGDSIYIFTDGFADQFGGEKGKKFKAANFKKLLLSIQDKSMDEQKDMINQAFESWKDDLEQVDDVCVIGVRV